MATEKTSVTEAEAARAFADYIKRRDAVSREVKAQIPTYYSETLGQRVTVPEN